MNHLTHPLSPSFDLENIDSANFPDSLSSFIFSLDATFVIKPSKIVFTPGKTEVCLVRLLESFGHNGGGMSVGVARPDIPEHGESLHQSHGWSLNTAGFLTYSGAPQYLRGKEYGPRKEDGCYVRDGDVIGLVMDMVKGELSFIVNGENLGVAFSGIPTDEPLIPCVICLEGFKCSVDFISWDDLNNKKI